MLVVGVLTTLGLWIVGVPLALALGVIAALFSFVPFIGPLFAFVPILLVASLEGNTMMIYALLVAIIVQVVESNVITPLIQKYAVSIPPAILLASQLILGILFGLAGLLLATPLALVLIILVQMLYVEDRLGEDVQVLGTAHAKGSSHASSSSSNGAEPTTTKEQHAT
jgi:predicted PurR-regulated permease PerM